LAWRDAEGAAQEGAAALPRPQAPDALREAARRDAEEHGAQPRARMRPAGSFSRAFRAMAWAWRWTATSRSRNDPSFDSAYLSRLILPSSPSSGIPAR